MPIVFIHGVAAREGQPDALLWEQIERYLRRYVAPVIADDPGGVPITRIFWGDLGVTLAWDGASIPTVDRIEGGPHQVAPLLARIDPEDRWQELRRRGLWMPTHIASRAASGARRLMSVEAVSFLGDALAYIAARGTAAEPGPIVRRVLDGLEAAHTAREARAGEPLVVFSHSMGGLIVYDVVSHYLPTLRPAGDLRLDFWAAAASQVGLFEEMKLLAASGSAHYSGTPVPAPSERYLGYWWNIWDPDDFLSFSVRGIIEGADDDFYKSGLGVARAHFGILRQPTFYQLFAEKLRAARLRRRPRP